MRSEPASLRLAAACGCVNHRKPTFILTQLKEQAPLADWVYNHRFQCFINSTEFLEYQLFLKLKTSQKYSVLPSLVLTVVL